MTGDRAGSEAGAPAPVTILGAGYVGRALLARFAQADATHRQRSAQPRTHVFDLQDPTSWGNPPLAGRNVIWTFPATPLDRVRHFHDTRLKQAMGLIVLGSTSAYRLAAGDGSGVASIDEHAPLDLDQPRVAGEQWLRAQGATVLQLAGIFGPGREPADWLRRGRITDGAKLVNLIHVDDIVAVIAHLLAHPRPGQRINLASGEPVPWRELAATLQHQGKLPADLVLPESRPGEHGKRVDTSALRAMLPHHRFARP